MRSFVIGFFHLAFSVMSSRLIHVVVFIRASFYGQIISYYMDIPVLFIHYQLTDISAVSWLLGVMLLWRFMHKYLYDYIFHFSWSGIAGSHDSSMLNFFGTARLICKVSPQLDIPAVYEGIDFSTSSPTRICIFAYRHPSGCEMIYLYGFHLHFPGTNDGEHLFMCLFSSVQLLSLVQLFVTPWIAAHQASLSITNS